MTQLSISGFDPMDTRQAQLLNSLQLAHVGDALWDLLVRTDLIYKGRNVRNMHKDAINRVNAGAQARVMEHWLPYLTEVEADVVRRGRNAHPHHAAPKNQDVVDYHHATALEALVGYLYLTGQQERLTELFKISQEVL